MLSFYVLTAIPNFPGIWDDDHYKKDQKEYFHFLHAIFLAMRCGGEITLD